MKVVTALVLAGLMAGNARADEPFHIGSLPKWIVLGGVETGGTVALSGRGALVGGELSVARLRERKFIGLYGDGYYDWGAHGTYTTAGVELGQGIVGLDGGAAILFAGGQHPLGATGRLSLGIGVVSLYARYLYFKEGDVLQVGLVIKLPLATFGGGY